ncbi:AraC family transcriptional regulator [Salidesulfovibrio onnuriiensis]|uniref:AraC family transcriptional regulator n=1 Tax=Salidesulfovibrio onnuriiensis TaxID=2583823 RepID=UPI0011C97105|nr:AraC family transcriptional regulator [Salidesulfovibrio onnuriiensis]
MLDTLVKTLEGLAPTPGCASTFLDDVILFRADSPSPRKPLIYDQCLCIAVQGKKIIHLSERSFTYDPSHFLVVPTVVPIECETFASPKKPFFAITILIDFATVQEIIGQLGDAFSEASASMAPQPGVYLESLTDDIIEPLIRLLKSLGTEGETKVLGKQILREIYYRVLLGGHGHILASAARGETAYARIATSLRTIHENYAETLDVPQLAESANMSVRSFHDHFKAVTQHTPVQYLKRIRLEKARRFMAGQGLQASVTAHMVGYESSSQFSREFKRHFGYPPSEARARDDSHTFAKV